MDLMQIGVLSNRLVQDIVMRLSPRHADSQIMGTGITAVCRGEHYISPMNILGPSASRGERVVVDLKEQDGSNYKTDSRTQSRPYPSSFLRYIQRSINTLSTSLALFAVHYLRSS